MCRCHFEFYAGEYTYTFLFYIQIGNPIIHSVCFPFFLVLQTFIYVISQHFQPELIGINKALASALAWLMLLHLHGLNTFSMGAHLTSQ